MIFRYGKLEVASLKHSHFRFRKINGEIYLRTHCSKNRRVVDFFGEVSILFLNLLIGRIQLIFFFLLCKQNYLRRYLRIYYLKNLEDSFISLRIFPSHLQFMILQKTLIRLTFLLDRIMQSSTNCSFNDTQIQIHGYIIEKNFES